MSSRQRFDYAIRVRNTGTVCARNVVWVDLLPRGLTFVRANVRSSLRSGRVTINLGPLGPRQVRTVRAAADIRGRRVNIASVSATDVRPARARAATTFRPLGRQILPGGDLLS